MGPDTLTLGERAQVPAIGQTRVAAILVVFLGEDYCAEVPHAGKPVPDVLNRSR